MNEKKLQKEKKYSKNTALNLVIILLLATIIVSAVIGLYAWAKYRSSIAGDAEAKVAKWHFDLTNTEGTSLSETEPIDLAETIDFEHVASKRIAPGTYGLFQIVVDTRGTEVDLVYEIEIALTDCPTNLNFYTDSEHTNLISKEGNKLTFSEYLTHAQAKNYNEPINIYWNWPYETLDSNNSSEAGDAQDNLDQGKIVIMNITATGTQVMEEPEQGERLADVVSVGDYVNYNAASGNGAEKIYTPEESLTGTAEGINTFSSSESMKWKVMSIDKTTGTVDLMAESPTVNTVKLYEKTGYKNAQTVLNNVGDVYGHGNGATGGRSITIEDVNKLEGNIPEDDKTGKEYTSGTFIMDDGKEVTATEEAPVTMSYTANTESKSTNKHYSYTVTNFSGKSFWIASCCLYCHSNKCNFGVRRVDSGLMDYGLLFTSDGSVSDRTSAVLPVVSLKSNIQTSGKDASGAWNLIIEQN